MEIIKWYLNLLEDSISYSRDNVIKHNDKLEIIVYLCFFEEESSVFEKSCDLIHTII